MSGQDSWEVEPSPAVFGHQLADLPAHLQAFHGWTDDDLARHDGRLRREHFHEHYREEQDHLTVDWSASRDTPGGNDDRRPE